MGVGIKSYEELEVWLQGQTKDWVRVVGARAAMRSFPLIGRGDKRWLSGYAALPMRAIVMSWAVSSFATQDMADAAHAAAEAAGVAAEAIRDDANAAANGVAGHDGRDYDAALRAVYATSMAAYAAANGATRAAAIDTLKASNLAARADEDKSSVYWEDISGDCNWLLLQEESDEAAGQMTQERLWFSSPPPGWYEEWVGVAKELRMIDSNYTVWIDWYERRIKGKRAAFDIPGDKGRKEDKAILRRLAEATDEDFWGKGHEYVNATLKGWLDEARARAAQNSEMIYVPDERLFTVISDEPETPRQESGAIAYGVNAEGKLDRLPLSSQGRLSDLPEVQGDYAALRRAVIELLEEGEQRLGPKLGPKLLNLFASLPEDFENAQAAPLWRDGNTLRRLHRKHVTVAKKADWDPNRLDDVAAEGLGEVLDFFNNLCFSDGTLRNRDERRISPQERENAEAEARAAAPLIKAVLQTPNITTSIVSVDIAADVENGELPADDPFAAQVLDESNRTWRNRVAAILSWAKGKIPDPATVPGALAYGVAGNSLYDTAKLAIPAAASLSQIPLFEFIATNAAVLLDYVAIAYPNHTYLPELIAQAKYLWQRLSGKV